MLDFFMNNLYSLFAVAGDCTAVLGKETTVLLQDVFNWVQLATPCLVLILCSVDCAQAVIAQDEKGMQKALNNSIKRISIGVAIFFVPVLLGFLLDMAGIATGVCKIGG